MVVAAVLVGVCGCNRSEDTEPAATATAAADSVAPDSVFRAPAEPVAPSTHRIYYTLTSHEWYAQGRPLVHEGQPHQPAGVPVNASADELTRAGEFEGVEYYTRAGEAGVVYVPVFEGYWQVFRGAAAEQPN